MGETGAIAVGAKKERLLTLSFQDADIQHMVEERMTADESLTRAAAIRAVFLELKEGKEKAENEFSEYRRHYAADLGREAEIGEERDGLKSRVIELERQLDDTARYAKECLERAQEQEALSIYYGLPANAEAYMQNFFAELIGEGHYTDPQTFFLDLLRRVQEGARTFIPGNQQIVKKEWIRH